MHYILKRKDEDITLVELGPDGSISNFKHDLINADLSPLHNPKDLGWLKDWWARRAVPISQGNIRKILSDKGLSCPEEYLKQNLGLSLTDYYWLCPFDSDLTWADVNLFDNDFSENLLMDTAGKSEGSPGISHYTPNSSLQGSLEKSWAIMDGERVLIKGNRGNRSSESINEVIASRLHELQGFDNHVDYKLIEIKNRDYDYGCYSKLFTSQKKELILAYDIVTSQKQPQDTSSIDHFVNVCGSYGMDKNELGRYLDYMIQSDFVLSQRDRHLSNIAVIRDADTLSFISPAPIYDSGKCLFADDVIPSGVKPLLEIPTASFFSNELALLGHVKDRSVLDITKLPSRDYVEEMYSMDSKMEPLHIKMIGEAYEKKVELLSLFRRGIDLNIVKVYFPRQAEGLSVSEIARKAIESARKNGSMFNTIEQDVQLY